MLAHFASHFLLVCKEKKMIVIKRNGQKEPVLFEKILARIKKQSYGLLLKEDDILGIAQKVSNGLYNGVQTSELDELAIETCANLTSVDLDYNVLATRILVSHHHKNTHKNYKNVIFLLKDLLTEKVYDFMLEHITAINSAIRYERDNDFDYFGLKTLMNNYLLKVNEKTIERPQHLWMRVACAIHVGDIQAALQTYELLSLKKFIHATPTLYFSGVKEGQLASCFLMTMEDDSIEGIYETNKKMAIISKACGGIGLNVPTIRTSGSTIQKSNRKSNGIVPMIRVINEMTLHVTQGGRRNASISVNLETWSADILPFLKLGEKHGLEAHRANEIFLSLWIDDLFLHYVEQDLDWYLFSHDTAPGLCDVYGDQFNNLYLSYVKQKLYRSVIKARDIWQAIIKLKTQGGLPYFCFKTQCNSKSNQKNLGTIRGTNLCTEIIEYTSPQEIAVCTLATIAVNMFVHDKVFDFQELFEVAKVVCKNLNKIIDINWYPLKECEYSNKKHRPIGIGIQGLADCFILMRYPFESKEAAELNMLIFETIYFAALTQSCDLSEEYGPYESYAGSPMSEGILQCDMYENTVYSKMWDWASLRLKIKKFGIRNSLLVAPPPTASTSQILGNNECFEPYTSNLYVRRTLAGEFICVSKHLIRDLKKIGLWSHELKNKLIIHEGSVQNIDEIPQDLKDLYKTVWEIKMKTLIDMAADRQRFICQSQSLNLWANEENNNYDKLTAIHFYGWRKGLKTMYYLRTKSASNPKQVTVDKQVCKRKEIFEDDAKTTDLVEFQYTNAKKKMKTIETEATITTDTKTSIAGTKVVQETIAETIPETIAETITETMTTKTKEIDVTEVLVEKKPDRKRKEIPDATELTLQSKKIVIVNEEALICSLRNREGCSSCSG